MDSTELLSDYSVYLKEQKEAGKQIIAFMAHDNIPEELIFAAGFIPLRMQFAGNDDLMNESHNYLPPSTCSFAQSCIGLFSLKPSQFSFLDLIDYFIVSNHCITDTCASEIISKYCYVPRLNFFSSYTQTDNALKYVKEELVEFKKQIEKISGTQISNDNILESIKKYNKIKENLSTINKFNIKGSEKLLFFQKAILYGPAILDELEDFVTQYESNPRQTTNNSIDLLLTGCSIFIGDFLIDLIEGSGGNILYFDTWVGNHYISQIIEDELLTSAMDPIDLFLQRYKNNIYGDHTVPDFHDNKLQQIEEYIQDYQTKSTSKGKRLGIINHIIKFCDHISIFQTYLKSKLQEKGHQVMNLERDYSKANRGQLSTRIEAFMEMMK